MRRLPPAAVLDQWHRTGITSARIAAMYGVTHQAVSEQLRIYRRSQGRQTIVIAGAGWALEEIAPGVQRAPITRMEG